VNKIMLVYTSFYSVLAFYLFVCFFFLFFFFLVSEFEFAFGRHLVIQFNC
jgi:hypothetical protein